MTEARLADATQLRRRPQATTARPSPLDASRARRAGLWDVKIAEVPRQAQVVVARIADKAVVLPAAWVCRHAKRSLPSSTADCNWLLRMDPG